MDELLAKARALGEQARASINPEFYKVFPMAPVQRDLFVPLALDFGVLSQAVKAATRDLYFDVIGVLHVAPPEGDPDPDLLAHLTRLSPSTPDKNLDTARRTTAALAKIEQMRTLEQLQLTVDCHVALFSGAAVDLPPQGIMTIDEWAEDRVANGFDLVPLDLPSKEPELSFREVARAIGIPEDQIPDDLDPDLLQKLYASLTQLDTVGAPPFDLAEITDAHTLAVFELFKNFSGLLFIALIAMKFLGTRQFSLNAIAAVTLFWTFSSLADVGITGRLALTSDKVKHPIDVNSNMDVFYYVKAIAQNQALKNEIGRPSQWNTAQQTEERLALDVVDRVKAYKDSYFPTAIWKTIGTLLYSFEAKEVPTATIFKPRTELQVAGFGYGDAVVLGLEIEASTLITIGRRIFNDLDLAILDLVGEQVQAWDSRTGSNSRVLQTVVSTGLAYGGGLAVDEFRRRWDETLHEIPGGVKAGSIKLAGGIVGTVLVTGVSALFDRFVSTMFGPTTALSYLVLNGVVGAMLLAVSTKAIMGIRPVLMDVSVFGWLEKDRIPYKLASAIRSLFVPIVFTHELEGKTPEEIEVFIDSFKWSIWWWTAAFGAVCVSEASWQQLNSFQAFPSPWRYGTYLDTWAWVITAPAFQIMKEYYRAAFYTLLVAGGEYINVLDAPLLMYTLSGSGPDANSTRIFVVASSLVVTLVNKIWAAGLSVGFNDRQVIAWRTRGGSLAMKNKHDDDILKPLRELFKLLHLYAASPSLRGLELETNKLTNNEPTTLVHLYTALAEGRRLMAKLHARFETVFPRLQVVDQAIKITTFIVTELLEIKSKIDLRTTLVGPRRIWFSYGSIPSELSDLAVRPHSIAEYMRTTYAARIARLASVSTQDYPARFETALIATLDDLKKSPYGLSDLSPDGLFNIPEYRARIRLALENPLIDSAKLAPETLLTDSAVIAETANALYDRPILLVQDPELRARLADIQVRGSEPGLAPDGFSAVIRAGWARLLLVEAMGVLPIVIQYARRPESAPVASLTQYQRVEQFQAALSFSLMATWIRLLLAVADEKDIEIEEGVSTPTTRFEQAEIERLVGTDPSKIADLVLAARGNFSSAEFDTDKVATLSNRKEPLQKTYDEDAIIVALLREIVLPLQRINYNRETVYALFTVYGA